MKIDIISKNILFFLFFIFVIKINPCLAANVPQTPINFEATTLSDTEISLTWQRIGSDETSITVWREYNGDYVKVAILPARSNIFTDTSLYPATQYNYKITADNGGGSSVPTAIASATTKASGASALAAENFTVSATSPYALNLSWTDNNTSSRVWFLERSTDNISYKVIKVITPASTDVAYVDTPLESSKKYYYRTRLVTGSNYSDYSNPVSATTQTAAPNLPFQPKNLSAVVNNATNTTLSWEDTNGGAATYLIETAPFAWWPDLPSWTQVTETSLGATNYNLSTVAEKFYYVRIRAKNANGNSAYSNAVNVRSASPGTGTSKTYEIGPGKNYTSIGALDWSLLGPGDTVNIYPNKDGNGNIIPYYEKPMISVRGTEAAPINIQGIPDAATGQKPIIDGTNAIENSQWNRSYMPIHDYALVLFSYKQNQTDSAWSPGYINFSNFEIRNGYNGDAANATYTAFDGSIRNYAACSGIYIEKGDHILIKNNIIHDNNEGIFGAGQGDQRNLENITIDSNYLYGNGTISNDRHHQTYIEGINDLYQFNKYGPLRVGSNGSSLKDRGAGTIIRYNWLEDGGHLIDLVEAQNYQTTAAALDSYHKTYVYGNLLYIYTKDGKPGATTPIHYGGDGGITPAYRKGILYFYNNTLVDHEDQSSHWYMLPFKLSSTGEALDARNNIFASIPFATLNHPEVRLAAGSAYFAKNWITSGWIYDGSVSHIVGTENLISNAQNNPGFASLASKNLQLLESSQCIDKQDDLPADWPVPSLQYSELYSKISRVINGTSSDLGALEFSSSSVKKYFFSDLGALINNWLKMNTSSDINTDGKVNTKDLGIMMSNWN